MIPIVMMACFMGLVLLVAVLAGVENRKLRAKMRTTWLPVCERFGGEFRPGKDHWLMCIGDQMECDYRYARVLVDCKDQTRNGRLTRVRARLPLRIGPTFLVLRRGVAQRVDVRLGEVEDVELGMVPEFDEMFSVKCNDVDAVRAVWSTETMMHTIQHKELQRTLVRSHRGEISVVLVRGALDVTTLTAMIELAGNLASADLCGRHALETLEGATYQPSSGPWNGRSIPRSEVENIGVRVTLEPVRVAGVVASRGSVHGVRAALNLDLAITEGRPPDDFQRPDGVPADTLQHLRLAGSGVLLCADERATFTWSGVVRDHAQLMAGVRALATLATSSEQGVFR